MSETINERSLRIHEVLKGKIGTEVKHPVKTREDLSTLYTPGVAAPCLAIRDNPEDVYKYTGKGNTVAIVTDGGAILGLGNIGSLAGLPVMEGKALLFKEFGGVNAVPICLATQNMEEIIQAVKMIAPTFGGINLEDIPAPRCVEIERRLQDALNIPVFHDDQHGAAIAVTAALINATKVVQKEINELTVVVNGIGAAGSAITKMLYELGVAKIYAFDKCGILHKKKDYGHIYNPVWEEISQMTNLDCEEMSLAEALTKADVFVGASIANILTPEMVKSMKENPIVFALANPNPEITYDEGKNAGAAVMATGRSDCKNQINNLLVFPGLFKGALRCGATMITKSMKIAAANAIASMITDEERNAEYIIPDPFDPRVADVVADAVEAEAIRQEVTREYCCTVHE